MREVIIKFRLARGEEKVRVAWQVVKEASKYSHEEPFWEFLKKKFNVKASEIKEIMRFLEKEGELEIKRSKDDKRLYVSTLKDIKKHPVTLEKWLK
ncbi:hypothetical protein PAP_04640 [Palaeococcus pacificus DY20341]|uniref:Uncharacterized protein n=1 Tax=Palaeococcus pacificus DY20341 TaxID=1343739 RepID=A0A075LSQ6_9EURY|nr:hypothetical protein [Palaeococcus pacificus]AIF69339.1 hypothetical protein PAP_04640 [Palaeococcus pacificus DY20341]